MQAVGILGGYISRGVYTVSGPFHPFGGGVDIIVVEQQDGSFKSSPWYIRFGKFSGVLKSRENVVNIVVNGNEAGFHMYLDSKGEAYFLQECESSEEGEFILPPLTSGDETNGSYKNGLIEKTQPSECESNQKESVLVDVENRKIDSGTDAHHYKMLGSIFKGKSVKDGDSLRKISRQDSLERAEKVADLLETRWSTNLPTASSARRNSPRIGSCDKDVNDVSPIVEDQGKINCDNALGSSDVGLSNKVDSEIATVEALGGDTGDMLPCLIAHQEIIEVCRSETEGDIADGFDVSHDIENGLAHAAGAVIEDLVENYSIANIESSNINKCALNEMGELATSHDSVDQVEDGNVSPYNYRETFECSSITHNDANDKSVQPFLERNDQISQNEDIYETSDVKNEISVNKKGNSTIGHHVHIERCTFINFRQNISPGVSDVQSPIANIGNMELSLPHTEQLFLDSALTDMDLQNQESNLHSVKRDGETEGFICQGVEYAKQDCSSENISQRDTEELNSHSQTDSARVHSLCSFDAKPHCLSSFSNANDLECQAAEITGLEVNGFKSSSAITAADRHVGYIFKKDANVSSTTSEMEDDHLLLYDDSTYCASDELPSETITSNKVQDEANSLVSPEPEVEEDNSEDITNRISVEALSGISVIQSLPICVPGSEANLEADVELSRSLPNLCSHLCHLEASDNFNKQSFSLPSCSGTFEEGKHEELFRSSEFNLCSDDTIIQAAREQISAEGLLLMSSKEQIDMKFNPAVELSLCKHLLFKGMGSQAAARAFEAEKIDLEKFAFLGPSIVKNNKLVVKIGSQYFPWDAAAPILLGMVSFGQDKIFDTKGMIAVDADEKVSNQSQSRPVVSNRGYWWFFNFGRQRCTSADQLALNENKQNDTKGETMGSLSGFSSTLKKRVLKKYVNTLTPSSQQLAFLNLKEGQNSVTLTYETALGRQQVDARIYLWKWNTRIVVSDVDGTITKSDVLGHVMPLVGKDWSQAGVAHLFSSIKDNGYQFLYLSARAVSQASLTRHFLFNLSQDGKTLPDGPVVISPDGLFPSLYREVIRRAPQEFKISCLEDIRALFPPDSNPFYAGFGNRPTDEISYLKVGIPKGKIFTVNPKGEVAAGQCFYTKSYSSLHALVHEIFPAASSVEQEDFNSWNFWRMPLLDVDDI